MPYLIGAIIGAALGLLIGSVVSAIRVRSIQAELYREKICRNGDCRALTEEIKTLRRSNRALRGLVNER